MSKIEKAKQRILSKPSDYTYSEAKQLLGYLGFKESNKGKTSGSKVKFHRASDNKVILLHKPHPGDEMTKGAVKQVCDYLIEIGELK